MVARTSSRQAAQKAKEAISHSAEEKPTGKTSAPSKRKAATANAPKSKKEKTHEQKPEPKKEDVHRADGVPETKPPEEKPQLATIPGTHEPIEGVVKPPETKPVEPGVRPEIKPPEEKPQPVTIPGTHESVEGAVKSSEGQPSQDVESGIHKSERRESIVSSNILEKGIVYFFFRPRVNVEEPQSIEDVARSFIVLRPAPLGTELDQGQGPIDKDARCRLLMLPKKKFPTSPKERDMAFVEKAGQTMQELQDKFISSSTYQTATRGERTIEEARPYAEGVYAITSTYRSSHLAYVLTIPAELGEIQANFGLYHRGSWIVQSKNPQFPGPAIGRLPKDPEYPESVLGKFGGLRWVPLKPEFIEYPNAQILMIGEAQDQLGKAATAEGNKQAHEEEPGQELEKLEQENEQRVEALQGTSPDEPSPSLASYNRKFLQAIKRSITIWECMRNNFPRCRRAGANDGDSAGRTAP
ncbi:hypothetical protein N7492_006495 [Penicillium capsulatum]|uniref:BTB domain transcription factor n=1 Tax=Penicillium capsulatum TaxID=69766 RepID=A0A9W9LKY2_9EURO|nr:hypothetical protein N7492_006495 [Penicillium capsulatum]KAJ6116334.1 hypothetical protein N7512_006059 [Penicillium capsulatum]